MIPEVPPGLHAAVLALMNTSVATQRSPLPPIDRGIQEDLNTFRQARETGASQEHPFFAAEFHDEDDSNHLLEVLVAPVLFGPGVSRLLAALQRSKVPVRSVSDLEAQNIVADRAAEFIAASAAPDGGGRGSGSATVVDSNRSGDTIVFCKGYFVSTATGFGVSTPAMRRISKGRYSFGIVEANGSHRFDNTLWTCPAQVRLNLP
jgi:hypothetical protein